MQCDKKLSQYNFFLQYSDVKRVDNVITTEEKVSRHENFAIMQEQSSADVLQSRCF